MKGHLHQLKIQSTMNIYEDNLDYLINFKEFNERLKRDILSVGDKQNKETNVKADMTYWQMHNKFNSFKELLLIIAKEKIDNLQSLKLIQGGKISLHCQDMWGAVYNKGDFTKEHNHIGSTFSFTYYVEVPQGSAPIVFTKPGMMQITPKKGTLLIWDSNYLHMVPEQQIDKPRIVIAGNINYYSQVLGPNKIETESNINIVK
jgi:hypothetical protein